MSEFLQQYGSFISAFIVIVFQVIKWLVNNRKMKSKFDDVSVDNLDYDKLSDGIVKKIDEKTAKVVEINNSLVDVNQLKTIKLLEVEKVADAVVQKLDSSVKKLVNEEEKND